MGHTDLHQTRHAYSLRPEREHRRVKNSRKCPDVRFLVKACPIARKLSTIEERRQDPSCLSRRGDYRNKVHNPQTLLSLIPSEEGFCNSETKHNRRPAPRPKLFVSPERLRRPQPRKSVLSSSFGEGGFFRSATKLDRSWQTDDEHRYACRLVADTGFRIKRRPSSRYIVGICVCTFAYS
jgi:hypothetical protein